MNVTRYTMLHVTRWVALLTCLMSTQCVAHARTADRADPFATLNQRARDIYGQARTELLQSTDPVLLVYSNERLVLLHDGQRETFVYASPQAAVLKSIAHVSLAAWTLLDRMGDQPAKWRPLAASFVRDMESIDASLANCGFVADELARQQKIVSDVKAALSQASGSPAVHDAAPFARAQAPLVMANVQTAAKLLLDGLNQQVQQVRQRLGPEKFAAMHVVILGSHMARTGEHAAQYFSHMFADEPEGRRWTYAENSWSEQKALEALGVHLIDKQASVAFFGDATRMHRDILSDATQEHLKTMTLPAL